MFAGRFWRELMFASNLLVRHRSMKFATLACSSSELRLDLTLCCGQSFRWQETGPSEWTGVTRGKLITLQRVEETAIQYHVHNSTDVLKDEAFIKDYFRLDENLEVLCKDWSERDKNFAKKVESFSGIRILRQDPVETLFAFICSSNNNITRISGMVEKLCTTYGQKLGHYKDKDYYSFPLLEALTAQGVEQTLRSLGFGYRAGYIHKTAKLIANGRPKGWLESLQSLPYSDAHSSLLQLCGVGAKVADCICLMGLDKLEAVPVDTHVWQIAVRDYELKSILKGKTMTSKAYQQVGDHFRQIFGPYAGWAHSILFSADLKKFQHILPETKQTAAAIKRKSTSTNGDGETGCKLQKIS